MAYRILELTIISAKDLKNVNLFSKMEVYAMATMVGVPHSQQRTFVDRKGGNNPSWNSTLRFYVPYDFTDGNLISIRVLLRTERIFGDRDVGEVRIPLEELFEKANEGPKFINYQVRKTGSGKAKGVLNISYKIVDPPSTAAPPPAAAKPVQTASSYPPPSSDKLQKKTDEPVMAYPAIGASGSAYPPSYPPAGYHPYPPQGAYAAYPPPPQANYGYGAPPQAGYGYGAPPPGAYGYQTVPATNRKNNLGLGLGAGLLGGAIGGMLIGDMVSDAAAYDSGYDAGFGDGLDF